MTLIDHLRSSETTSFNRELYNVTEQCVSKYRSLTVADTLDFVLAVVAVYTTIADEQVANTFRIVTATAHLALRTFVL